MPLQDLLASMAQTNPELCVPMPNPDYLVLLRRFALRLSAAPLPLFAIALSTTNRYATPTGMASVAGAAVLGPDASPWFLQAFTSNEDEPLRFQRAVHCALDAVPPVQALSSTAQPSSSTPPPTGYLGVIFASAEDACAVYGYVTATSVTLMLALEGDDDVRDADMRAAFDRFHAAYSDAVANPFHTLGQPISSTKFVQRVKSVCRGVR